MFVRFPDRGRRACRASRRVRRQFRLEGLEHRCLLSITEFPLPSNGSVNPVFIASGPDGNVWFEINDGTNGLGMISPTSHAITEFSAGWGPIVAGPDSNIWFANTAVNPNTVGMINPATHAVTEFAIPTANSDIEGITTGPNGNIWFTETSAGKIAEINPTTHAVTEFPIYTSGSSPRSITSGPDGNLWFTEGIGKIGTMNPVTGAITEFPLPTGSFPSFITPGPDGNLWFTVPVVNGNTSNLIGKINPTTDAITELTTPTVASYPNGITAGPDGNLWFTETLQLAGRIGTINPTNDTITEFAVPYTNSGPWGITAGPDGNIWFADWDADAIGVDDLNSAQFVVKQQPPASTAAGTGFGLTVQAEDRLGNLDSSYNGLVTVALANEPGGAMLDGTLSVMASGGIATFSGLTLNTAASGYTLAVSASGVDGALTSAITVTPASASQLVIHTQPSATATAGQAFGAQPVIEEEDQYGNVETSDNSTVITATLESGTGPLQGTITATVSGGVATFTNLAENTAGTISLAFSGDGLTDATSSSIVISPAAPSQLVIETEPSSTATAGHAFATEPVVYEEDQFGNLETGDNSKLVSVTLGSGTGPLQGTTQRHLVGWCGHVHEPGRQEGRDDLARVQQRRPRQCHLRQHRRQSGGHQRTGDPNPAVGNSDGRAGICHPAGDL